MDSAQVQYHPNSRIPLETLYPNPDRPGRITVLNDVKGVLGHAVAAIDLVAFAGKEIISRVPTPLLLGGLFAGAAAITFLPIMCPAAICCSFALPALPVAGFTLTNMLGTTPMFFIGGYLLTKLVGARPADKMAWIQELPERRLLRRVNNLGLFNLVGSHFGMQALGFAGNPVIGWMKYGLQKIGILS